MNVCDLIAKVDLCDQVERLMLSDELESLGRMAEAILLRVEGPVLRWNGRLYGPDNFVQYASKRFSNRMKADTTVEVRDVYQNTKVSVTGERVGSFVICKYDSRVSATHPQTGIAAWVLHDTVTWRVSLARAMATALSLVGTQEEWDWDNERCAKAHQVIEKSWRVAKSVKKADYVEISRVLAAHQ